MAPRPLLQLCGQCDVEQCGELYRSPRRLYTRAWLSSVPKTNRDSSLNTTFCQSVTFHIDLAWHHCRRSCRCSGVKGSARKGRLDLRFASARCLEIICGTIATPTSARIVERVIVESTSVCCTILRSSVLVVFLVTPDPVIRVWVPFRVHCSQEFLMVHSERFTWPATRRVDKPAVFIPMIRLLSNSLNCEKCLLARLPGMFRLPKSSYNRRRCRDNYVEIKIDGRDETITFCPEERKWTPVVAFSDVTVTYRCSSSSNSFELSYNVGRKAVSTPSHKQTSPIFSIDQVPVRRSVTWFFVSSPESNSKSLCGRRVELCWQVLPQMT
ncbi:uncharacterized protein TNCV_4174701 [Trichonephila clavipes]|nr:uncharacterized protein TNCV_4174701 [Trichonephila clavipes]